MKLNNKETLMVEVGSYDKNEFLSKKSGLNQSEGLCYVPTVNLRRKKTISMDNEIWISGPTGGELYF